MSADVSRVCDVVYEEERSWSGVTQQCLEYMVPDHISLNRLIYCYPPREESAQKERSASILRHKFQKYPLTPQFCAAVLGPRFAHDFFFFKITKRNMRKIRLKIDSPYLQDLLKNRSFWQYSSSLSIIVVVPHIDSNVNIHWHSPKVVKFC